MRLSTTAQTAQVSFGAGVQARFGALRPSEEKKIFNVLPPELRIKELINQNEVLSRLPMGFESSEQRTARENQQKKVEQQLLKEVQSPGFSKQLATALLVELYESRDVLQQELPEAIFNAIYARATQPEPRSASVDEAQDAGRIPESLRKRVNGGAARIYVPSKADLEALLAAAAQKGYGSN